MQNHVVFCLFACFKLYEACAPNCYSCPFGNSCFQNQCFSGYTFNPTSLTCTRKYIMIFSRVKFKIKCNYIQLYCKYDYFAATKVLVRYAIIHLRMHTHSCTQNTHTQTYMTKYLLNKQTHSFAHIYVYIYIMHT